MENQNNVALVYVTKKYVSEKDNKEHQYSELCLELPNGEYVAITTKVRAGQDFKAGIAYSNLLTYAKKVTK